MRSRLYQVFYLAKFAVKSRARDVWKKPLLCSFKITDNCNLKCAHCPFWRTSEKSSLDFESAINILDNLYSEGVRIVIFEGGEPLLWKDEKSAKDINDVIEYAKKLFFFTGVTTNGTIDIERFSPNIFFISIDGFAETHDMLRGKSFGNIMKNIEKNSRHKKIIANICISSENADETEELVKYLNDKVHGITIQFFYPYDNVGDLKLGSHKKKELLKNLIVLKNKGIKLLNSLSCMKMMVDNTWKCDDFLVANVEQDGTLGYGCYLKNKTPDILCSDCGFTVHCEISLAYRFNVDAIKSAMKIFWGKNYKGIKTAS
jgi:Fe-coproporphyrin III synthase